MACAHLISVWCQECGPARIATLRDQLVKLEEEVSCTRAACEDAVESEATAIEAEMRLKQENERLRKYISALGGDPDQPLVGRTKAE